MNKLSGLALPVFAFLVVACGSGSQGVASVADLYVADEPALEAAQSPTPEAIEGEESIEAAVMAFTQCMRDEGLQLLDPEVDSDGNVQRPVPVEGFQATQEEWTAGFQACSIYLAGITRTVELPDPTELADMLFELAQCLREHDIEVADPDMSLPTGAGRRMLAGLDFQDPAVQEALEACNFQELLDIGRGARRGQ